MIRRASWGRPPGGPFSISGGAILLGMVLAVVAPAVAVAHGPGGPWLAVEPHQVNPGGTIEIRGDNLGADEDVTVSLVGGGRATELGVGTTDGEGHLVVFLAIPTDTPPAPYGLMGQTASGSIARGTFIVAGQPIVDSESGNQQERGPIGPLPSSAAPATAVTDGVGAQPSAPVPVGPSGAWSDALLLLAAVSAAALLVGVPIARRARARPS